MSEQLYRKAPDCNGSYHTFDYNAHAADQFPDGLARCLGTDCGAVMLPVVPVEHLGVGEFADRVGLKKSTVYVYKSKGRLPKPDLVVNGGNTALWLDSTVDRWNEER